MADRYKGVASFLASFQSGRFDVTRDRLVRTGEISMSAIPTG